MKGQPRPTYSANRHEWLRRLADHPGATRRGSGGCAFFCMELGWTAWRTPGRAGGGEVLTDAGRLVLEQWDAAGGKPPKPARAQTVRGPRRPSTDAPFEVRIGWALRAGGLQALADWLVFTGQDGDLLAVLATRAPEQAQAIAQLAATRERACCAQPPLGQVCDGEHLRVGMIRRDPVHVSHRTLEDCQAFATGGIVKEGPPLPLLGEDGPTSYLPKDQADRMMAASPGNPKPHLGTPVGAYLACEACGGTGRNGRTFACHQCHGNGKVKRTVTP